MTWGGRDPGPGGEDRLERLYEEALALPDAQRGAFLDEACAGDTELRAQLESLLSDSAGAEAFMEDLGRLVEPEPQGEGEGPPERLVRALAERYSIEATVGEGGMATVYRAQDLRHERKVALKVLRPELSAVVGSERFLAEIKTTANLQHPNILPLFDSGEADGYLFYVMPYVEGESLHARLDREYQLPVEDAVRIATTAAEALDYAHRQGVIHRDIKPGNLLLQDGKPVISDFGIALAVTAGGGSRLTETGFSLGTPHYMSPEQASADVPVGPATDIYALGCVLYEMLVGEPPHTGRTAQAVLARVMTSPPERVAAYRTRVPDHVDAAVARALEKVPSDRFATAGAFAAELAGRLITTPSMGSTRRSSAPSPVRRLAYLAGIVGLVALTWALASRAPSAASTAYLSITLEPDLDPRLDQSIRISSDGSMVVYTAADGTEGRHQLWARRWSSATLEARPIPNSSGVQSFDVSPDNTEVALLAADSAIRIQAMESSAVTTVLAGGVACCLTWSDDGAWIYFTNAEGGVSRVTPEGGAPEVLTRSDGGPRHVWPHPVAGTDLVVFELAEAYGIGSRVALVDVSSREIRELTEGTNPTPVDDLILFSTNTYELRVLNWRSAEAVSTRIATGLAGGQGGGARPVYDVSASGDLIFVTGEAAAGRALYGTPVWVARDGTETWIDSTLVARYRRVRLSPDGSRLALSTLEGGGRALIYVKELAGGPPVRITPQRLLSLHPTWAHDGSAIYYTFLRDPATLSMGIFGVRPDGAGVPTPVGPRAASAMMTPDARWWVYRTPNTRADRGNLLAVHADLASPPVSLVATEASESQPTVSRDGRWFAYSSDEEGGVRQVYVRPFPNAADWWIPVTSRGGMSPAFSPAADELFVVEDGWMTAFTYTTEPTFRVTGREQLFDASGYSTGLMDSSHDYDVTDDGRRFVMIRRDGLPQNAPQRIVLVLDFLVGLRGTAR